MTTNPFIDKYGTQLWYLNNELHRDDGGPAVIFANGEQQWYIHGERHREDGPAVILANNTQYWYVNGNLHRLDGPSCIWLDGTIAWHVNGENITKEVNEWMKKNKIKYPFDNKSLVLFKLTFG